MSHRSQLPPPLYSLTVGGSHHFVRCWEITRRDGVVMRFTDHSAEVVFAGEVYSPVGGFRASAEEGEEGLTPGNRELLGTIRSDRITDDDLRAGRYRRAVVREFTVDSRFPWAGTFRSNIYIIQEVLYNDQTWEAQVEGPLGRLKATVGSTAEVRCRWVEFGGEHCGVDLSTLRVSGRSVTVVSTPRLVFQSDVPTGQGDNFYNDGKIEWQTGANAGTVSDIKDYDEADGVVSLYVKTLSPIVAGDVFHIVPGCDRQLSTCDGYNNLTRFGGFPFLPGTNELLTTPDVPPAV